MKIHRFLGELMERVGHFDTCVSVRPGSSKVFVGMDFTGRYAGQDILIDTEDARRMAKALMDTADAVDEEIARDAAEDARIEAERTQE